MKIKRILAFLLTLTLVLGVLPIAAFAAYVEPTIEEVEEYLNNALDETGEENAKFIYANDLESAEGSGKTLTVEDGTGEGSFYVNEESGPTHMHGTGSAITWRSDSSNNTTSGSNKNNSHVDIRPTPTKSGISILNKSYVFSTNITLHTYFEGSRVHLFRAITSSHSFVQMNPKTGELLDNGGNSLGVSIKEGETVTVTTHVKFVSTATDEKPNSVKEVYDVYLDGVKVVSDKEATTSSTGLQFTYIRFNLPGIHLAPYKDANNDSVNDYVADGLLDFSNVTDNAYYTCKCTACGGTSEGDCLLGVDLLSLNSIKVYYSDVCYEAAPEVPVEDGVNVYVDEDLALRYYTNDDDVTAVTFTAEGRAPVEVTEYTTDNNGNKVFTFDGIAPQEIDKPIKIETNVATAAEDFTITGYCKALLANDAKNAKLAALIGDLIVYANAAKAYLGENGTIDQIGTPSGATPAEAALTTAGNTAALYIAFAGVEFNSTNRIFFEIYSAGGAFTANIGGKACEAENLGEGLFRVYTDAISSTEFGTAYTLTVTEGENTATVEYSVNTYAYRMQNSENASMKALAAALYSFGQSCVAYNA